MMKATMSSVEAIAAGAGEQAEHEQHPEDDLDERQGQPDPAGEAVGKQLVGLHGALGGERLADLGGAGVDEHDAEEEPRDECR